MAVLPVTDHYDGKHFYNNWEPRVERSFVDVLRWRWTSKHGAWPSEVPIKIGEKPPAKVETGIRITLVNHATFLIQTAGINILTDPVWSEKIGVDILGFKFGRKRVHPPGIRFEDLPAIDYVLLSHNHYDHMDLPTLRRLRDDKNPKFISALGNASYLEAKGITGASDMDWWDSRELARGVTLISVPAQHWSRRSFFDSNKTLWCGFVLKTPKETIFFAGDTGFGSFFQTIRENIGPVNVALLPIGDYLPAWFMGHHHMNPAEDINAAEILGARTWIPFHYNTFQLADNSYDGPMKDLDKASSEIKGVKSQVKILVPGGFLNLN